MAVTDDQPVSAGNLKELVGGGYLGGAVLYDDPGKLPQDNLNSDTVTLSKAVEGYRTLDVWLLTYDVSGSYSSSFVSFPANIRSIGDYPHPRVVGLISNLSSTRNVIYVDQLSGTTLKINVADSVIVRVVGRN